MSSPQPSVSYNSACDATVVEEIKKYDWDVKTAVSVALAESHCRADAINYNTNGSIDEGVFQINSIHSQPNMKDLKSNVAYAYELYKRQGWQPWVAYNNGSYLRYYNQ